MPDQTERIEHLRDLEPHLRAHIRGQDHLLSRVSAAFARGALGLTSTDRPRTALLLVGPTGSGKSATFSCATDYVCGPGRMVCFDMSEYHEKSAILKLLGENRDDPGLLGRALAALPEGGVLFDEFEKAHPLILDLFLQILWEGRITVATGETFRFGNYYVGFTSNIGGLETMRMDRSAFASIEQATLRRVEQSLRPELVGRIDEKLVFARLTPNVQREICEREVKKESNRLRDVGYDLEVSLEAIEFLVREGFHQHLGARPLRKTVERHLQDAVVRALFANRIGRGTVVLDSQQRGLTIRG